MPSQALEANDTDSESITMTDQQRTEVQAANPIELVTYDLPLSGNEVPAFARVTITQDDLLLWQKHAKYVRENDNLCCVEVNDYRCQFLSFDLEPAVDFRQNTSRVVVFMDRIYFTGYEKNCGSESEWNSDPLDLDNIAKDLEGQS